MLLHTPPAKYISEEAVVRTCPGSGGYISLAVVVALGSQAGAAVSRGAPSLTEAAGCGGTLSKDTGKQHKTVAVVAWRVLTPRY